MRATRSIFMTKEALGLTAKKLLEYTSGPMDVLMNGLTASFESSIKALTNLHRSHDVHRVYADGGMIILNDTQTDWVKHIEEECCSVISFFYADRRQ